MGGDRSRPLAGLARGAGWVGARLGARRPATAPVGGPDLDSSGQTPSGTPGQTDVAVAVPVAGGPDSVSPDRTDLVTLRILAISDFHGALLGAGKRGGRPVGGAAYLASYLERERDAVPGRTLLLHAGDVVGNSPPVSGLLQDEPTIAVLDAIGFDAGVVGTHEFDEGLDELFRLLDGGAHPTTLGRSGNFPGCSFPWLAANVVAEATGHPILPAYRIFDLAGFLVGVVGILTTETPDRVGGGTLGLRFEDEAATVNRYVHELRDGPDGVDAVVVLAHLAGSEPPPSDPGSGEMARFAAALSGVNAIVGGRPHHNGYVATVAGTLVVQPPPFGAAYAVVDLALDPHTRRVERRTGSLAPVWQDAVMPDPYVGAIVDRATALAADLAAAPVALNAAPLNRSPDAAAVGGLGALIARAFLRATGAEIALLHPDEVRADLPSGTVTRGDLYAALPGGRAVVTVRLTGEAIRHLLETQWTRERTSRLVLAGAEVEIAVDAPHGRRVRRVRLDDGRALERGRTYAVAMTGFLAGGADGFGAVLIGAQQAHGPLALDAFTDYLAALHQPISPAAAARDAAAPVAAPPPADDLSAAP